MTDPQTPNKQFNIPTRGSDIGVWDTSLNSNFSSMDSLLGAGQSVALSAADVTLTETQANNLYFNLTGTLLANVVVSFPAIGGLFIIKNSTTGAFSVTINTTASGSTGTIVAQGDTQLVYLDGTNAYPAGASADYIPSGTSMLFLQAAAPLGWTQVTANNDTALRVVSGTGGGVHGTVGLDTFISNGALAHALTLAEAPTGQFTFNDPGHSHTYEVWVPVGIGSGGGPGASNQETFSTNSKTTGCTLTDNAGGGTHVHSLSDLAYIDSINCTKD